jgi:3-deoxy-manno-octulosonate cytidylyltransferase (CMP-KDO synthetase)
MATAVTPIRSNDELLNPSIVKCVTNLRGEALYFSRSAIPHKGFSSSCFHHIGLYCYRPEFLLRYVELPATPLQLAEDLEQLKALEHGFSIQTAIIDEESIGVDHPEDIIKVKEFLCRQNLYL